MKVKKYTAPTMPEAMKKVRSDLGAEAVILNSKEVYMGGFMGLFKKRNIQVIAALDKQAPIPKKAPSVNSEKSVPEPAIEQAKNTESVSQDVLNEIREMKVWMKNSNANQTPDYPLPLQTLYHYLIDKEVEKEITMEWIDDLSAAFSDRENYIPRHEIVQQLSDYLKEKFSAYDFSGIDYTKKFIHFAGPTGVGKTTTIAKLAAKSVMKDRKKVALITTDTYRIAAIDQLKTYSKILEIPLEVVYTHEDYLNARDKFQDYDLVLVDTAGRNFRNEKYVKELGSLVDLEKDVDTYLVLSLTSKYVDQLAIYKQFNSIPIKQFIFTKEDETSSYGSMINMMELTGKGIAYITNGQEVPDDISELSIEKINELIVGDYANE